MEVGVNNLAVNYFIVKKIKQNIYKKKLYN